MPKQVEPRVNKALISVDGSRLGRDDASDDSYTRVEAMRGGRDPIDTSGAQTPYAYDRIEELRTLRTGEGDGYDRVEEIRAARADEAVSADDTIDPSHVMHHQ